MFLVLSPTVSSLSLWSLSDLFRWFDKIKMQAPDKRRIREIVNYLVTPSFMSFAILPIEKREWAKSFLLSQNVLHEKVKKWIDQSPNNSELASLLKFLTETDQLRKNDYKKIIPQLTELQ